MLENNSYKTPIVVSETRRHVHDAPEHYVDDSLQHYVNDTPQHLKPVTSLSRQNLDYRLGAPHPFPQSQNFPSSPGKERRSPSGTDTNSSHLIFGLRKTTFWLVLTLILLLLAAGISGGIVGTKVGKNKSTPASGLVVSTTIVSPSSAPTNPSPISSSIPPISASPTSSGPISSATGTLGPGGVLITCPSSDNANYTAPNSRRRFVRQCNTDYSGCDIQTAQLPTQSMTDCIDACMRWNADADANATRCVAVSWSYATGPQGTDLNYCWLKSAICPPKSAEGHESAKMMFR